MGRGVVGSIAENILLHRLCDARCCPKSLGELEAGVVAKAVGASSHVSPVLFGVSPRDLSASPLGKFQCTQFTESDVERLLKAINESAGAPIPEPQVARRFRRSWARLRDGIGRIDLPDAEDLEEPDDLDNDGVGDWLEEIEEKILETVTWSGDERPLELLAIAGAVGENHVHAQHYVDQLVDRGFLHKKLNTAYPTTYFVTKKGRAHAVENDLV